jgi:O-antigen/teichoic acid export membrane protein
MKFIDIIKYKITRGHTRSTEAKKNIILSFGNKGLSILINLLLVPLTINYVNPTQYGIWLTLSSIIAWIAYFDFGFAHGFRNRFTEANARGDISLARKYVSTTYVVLGILFLLIFIIAVVVNSFLSWSSILNISIQYENELSRVVLTLLFFLCTHLVLNVFVTLLLADQKPALSAFITTLGQLLALIIIVILTKTTQGSLFNLALVITGLPCIVTFIVSIVAYKTKYSYVSPSIKHVDFSLIKNILGLGGKFFIIQICLLFVFQFMNLILTRIQGPEAVTEYNIAYKYFSIIYMIYGIIVAPFWSAFTDAYTQEDYNWMKRTYSKLSRIWFITIIIISIMLILSNYAYKIWIGDSVKISFTLSLFMSIYILVLSRAHLYMSLINGIGKISLQTIIYVIFSFVSIPLMVYLTKRMGTVGVLIIPIIVYIFQALIGHIQIKKILSKKANGIWNK